MSGLKKLKEIFIIGGSRCFFLSGKILITSNGNFMIVFDIVSQFYFEMWRWSFGLQHFKLAAGKMGCLFGFKLKKW